jgi:hypothetical protein
LPADAAPATRERLRALFDRFAHASCLPFGREPDAVLGPRCGTQCGSCLPALRGLVQRQPTLEAAA